MGQDSTLKNWASCAAILALPIAVVGVSLAYLQLQGCAPATNPLPVPGTTAATNPGPKLVDQGAPLKEYVNSLGMKFAWIPPGNFLMGSPVGEKGRDDDEVQHRVTLTKGFWLGVYPVNQAELQAVMKNNPSHFKGDNRPVEQVSWQDCQAFCAALSKREGKTYRLPTESEWEYACRAGATTAYCFGDDPAQLGEYAWYVENSDSVTYPVGRKKPNAWGLYDMHGNVWQWCQDWYGDYPRSDQVDPLGPAQGSHRVIRGGSWRYYGRDCRSADRIWFVPVIRLNYLGFRLALVPPG